MLLLNLLIVIDNPEKKDIKDKKTASNTALSYMSSMKKIVENRKKFEQTKQVETELSTLYLLLYGVVHFYNNDKPAALREIKNFLAMNATLSKEFEYEARSMHYIGTILMTQVLSQDIFQVLETKRSDECVLRKNIEKKIEKSESIVVDIENGKYKSIEEKKLIELKERTLNSQKNLFNELYKLEHEMNSTYLSKEFMEILDSLLDNLSFIEEEMLNNNYLKKEVVGKNEDIYPANHIADLIYAYLQSQKVKLLFYKRDFEKTNELIMGFFKQAYSSQWESPVLVLRSANMEDNLVLMMPYKQLESFNKYINKIVYEVEKDRNDKIVTYAIRPLNENEENDFKIKLLKRL